MGRPRKRLIDELRERAQRNGTTAGRRSPPLGEHPGDAWEGGPEPAPTAEAWEAPIPLAQAPEADAFPLRVLPDALARFVQDVALAKNCPPDYVAIPLLTIAGAAIGASRALEIKPGWRERPCLYAAVIGPPGSSKTPALRAVASPVYAEQDRRFGSYRRQRQAWDEDDESRRGAPPRLETIYVSDITAEKLAGLLRDNPRGVVQIRDELTAWVEAMGEYKNGRGTDRQAYLSVWAGEPIRIDRKKEPDPIYVSHPFVAVVGGLTPSMLPALRGEHERWDGFIDRVLLAYPAPLPAKGEDWLCVDPEIAADWEATLHQLWELQPELTDNQESRPHYVRLTKSGRGAWEQFTAWLADEQNRDNLPDFIRGHLAKFRGYGARLALLLHCLRRVCREVTDEDVDAESVQRAGQLIGYFRSHCLKVHALLDSDPQIEDALRVLAWLERERRVQFKRYDVFEDVKSRHFPKIEDLDPPLDRLEKHCFIRRRPAAPQGRGRPADPVFEVNPALLENHPKNPTNPKKGSRK